MGDTGNCGTELNFYFILFHAARNFYLPLPSFPFFYFGVEVFLKLAFMKVLMCICTFEKCKLFDHGSIINIV